VFFLAPNVLQSPDCMGFISAGFVQRIGDKRSPEPKVSGLRLYPLLSAGYFDISSSKPFIVLTILPKSGWAKLQNEITLTSFTGLKYRIE